MCWLGEAPQPPLIQQHDLLSSRKLLLQHDGSTVLVYINESVNRNDSIAFNCTAREEILPGDTEVCEVTYMACTEQLQS